MRRSGSNVFKCQLGFIRLRRRSRLKRLRRYRGRWRRRRGCARGNFNLRGFDLRRLSSGSGQGSLRDGPGSRLRRAKSRSSRLRRRLRAPHVKLAADLALIGLLLRRLEESGGNQVHRSVKIGSDNRSLSWSFYIRQRQVDRDYDEVENYRSNAGSHQSPGRDRLPPGAK